VGNTWVGHYLAQWREHRGLTQSQLADRMGVTRGYVSHIETGKRRYDQDLLESASTALSCTPADIISRNPAMERETDLTAMSRKLSAKQAEKAAKIIRLILEQDGDTANGVG